MGADVRERTDALDAAGNTSAAIGKGFAIGSAALVSLSLFGAFTESAGLAKGDASLLEVERTTAFLLVGAMLPSAFSACTVRGVGTAAVAVVAEVRRQFNTIAGLKSGGGRPDYDACVAICSAAAMREMVMPGLITLVPVREMSRSQLVISRLLCSQSRRACSSAPTRLRGSSPACSSRASRWRWR
jgi:inorganic pyrophosphatase